MGGAKVDALEWALALLRAPGERHALRGKPLPAGMDRLLGVAAGTLPEGLEDTARAFNETQATIQEAAQFYAREVLLFPQADAYRVLGVDAAAPAEQIKSHYRLLQLWLHPDRSDSHGDAVFAARVNHAWNQLRSPERRQAYDLALGQVHETDGPDGSAVDARGRGQIAPRAWLAEPGAAEGGRWRRLSVIVLALSCVALMVLTLRDLQDGAEYWEPAPAGVEPKAAAEEGDLAGLLAAPPDSAPPRMRRAGGLAGNGQALAQAFESVPAIAPGPVGLQLAPVPPPAERYPPETPAPVLADEVVEASVASSHPPAPPQPRAATASAEVGRTAARTAPLPDSTKAVAVDVTADAETAPVPPDTVRVRAARQVGEQLVRYLESMRRSSPAIWNSPVIQSSAELMRQELHSRGKVTLADPRWRIGNAIAAMTLPYRTAATTDDGSGRVDVQGRLTADLAWRDGLWLVVGLGIEEV